MPTARCSPCNFSCPQLGHPALADCLEVARAVQYSMSKTLFQVHPAVLTLPYCVFCSLSCCPWDGTYSVSCCLQHEEQDGGGSRQAEGAAYCRTGQAACQEEGIEQPAEFTCETGLQRQPSATMLDNCFTLVQHAAVACRQPSVASDPLLKCSLLGRVPYLSSSSCNYGPADQACCCCHAPAA